MALNRSDKSRILRRYFPGMTRNSEMSTEPSDLTNDLLGDSDARAKTLPAWFQELARKVDSNILPNFRQVDEARKLAGWSEAAMRQAVQKYVQVYRGKTVKRAGDSLPEAGDRGGPQGPGLHLG